MSVYTAITIGTLADANSLREMLQKYSAIKQWRQRVSNIGGGGTTSPSLIPYFLPLLSPPLPSPPHYPIPLPPTSPLRSRTLNPARGSVGVLSASDVVLETKVLVSRRLEDKK